MTLFETLFEIEEGKDPESKRCTMEVSWKKITGRLCHKAEVEERALQGKEFS